MGILAFHRAELVSGGTDAVFPEVSRGIFVGAANAVQVALAIIELSSGGAPVVTLELEGSNDMQTWVSLGLSMAAGQVGVTQAQADAIGTRYVRCRAWLETTEVAGVAIIATDLNMFDSAA